MPTQLDHRFYPQILDRVVYFAPFGSLLRLRAVSRALQRVADKYMVEHIAYGTDPGGARALREPRAPFRRLPMSYKGILCKDMMKRLADVRCVDYYGTSGGMHSPRIMFPEAVLRQMGPMAEIVSPLSHSPTRVEYQDCRHYFDEHNDELESWVTTLEVSGARRAVAYVRVRTPECGSVEPFTYCYPFDRRIKTAVLVIDMYDKDKLSPEPDEDTPPSSPLIVPSPTSSKVAGPPVTDMPEQPWDDDEPHWGFMARVPNTVAKMLLRGVELEIVGLDDVPPVVLGMKRRSTLAEVKEALCASIRGFIELYKNDFSRFGKPDSPTRNPDVAMANLRFDTMKGWSARADWREAEKPPVPEFWLGWQPDDGQVDRTRLATEVPFPPCEERSDDHGMFGAGYSDGEDASSEGSWTDYESVQSDDGPAPVVDMDDLPPGVHMPFPRPIDDFERDWDTELEYI